MKQRKWKAWWEIPRLEVTMNVYPYKIVYIYGKITEYGARPTTAGIVRSNHEA